MNTKNYDKFHVWEIFDRLHMIQEHIDIALSSHHPFIAEHPEIEELIQNAQKYLSDAYQKSGIAFDDIEEKESK